MWFSERRHISFEFSISDNLFSSGAPGWYDSINLKLYQQVQISLRCFQVQISLLFSFLKNLLRRWMLLLTRIRMLEASDDFLPKETVFISLLRHKGTPNCSYSLISTWLVSSSHRVAFSAVKCCSGPCGAEGTFCSPTIVSSGTTLNRLLYQWAEEAAWLSWRLWYPSNAGIGIDQ